MKFRHKVWSSSRYKTKSFFWAWCWRWCLDRVPRNTNSTFRFALRVLSWCPTPQICNSLEGQCLRLCYCCFLLVLDGEGQSEKQYNKLTKKAVVIKLLGKKDKYIIIFRPRRTFSACLNQVSHLARNKVLASKNKPIKHPKYIVFPKKTEEN